MKKKGSGYRTSWGDGPPEPHLTEARDCDEARGEGIEAIVARMDGSRVMLGVCV